MMVIIMMIIMIKITIMMIMTWLIGSISCILFATVCSLFQLIEMKMEMMITNMIKIMVMMDDQYTP